MKETFFPRLAASNIKKNRRTYVPFILTCILTTAMFYIIKSLSLNSGIENMSGGNSIAITMDLGSRIVGMFAFIFLFYTNSFLIKQRKKEFGMFNILGMEKRHLSIVIGWETFYVAVISLVVGLGIGIALDKMMFLLIQKLLKAKIALGFFIAPAAISATVLLFAVIFVLIFLNAVRQVHVANPVELLRAGNAGEKEPKTKALLALLGILCVAAGYYLAIVTKNPIASIYIFFVAVILVIIGTYLLFTAGSIALLKMLRKNKVYYYKTKHFTSISGMIYRMKQNAVGLANICILSTMVLVTVSSTVAMMVGVEDMLRTRYPNHFSVIAGDKFGESTGGSSEKNLDENSEETMGRSSGENLDGNVGKSGQVFAAVRELQEERGLHVTNEEEFSYLSIMMFCEKDGITFTSVGNIEEVMSNGGTILMFVPLADYNALMRERRTLQKGEVFVYPMREQYDGSALRLYGKEYRVAKKLEAFPEVGFANAMAFRTLLVVVPDMEQMQEINEERIKDQEAAGHGISSGIQRMYGFDADAGEKEQKAFAAALKKRLAAEDVTDADVTIEARVENRMNFVSLYGGFFFIGVFLAALFGMATVLIIYYKQISEGYDDKERFAIMQKVGMSLQEVRASIRSQVLTVFFLPLVVAGCHVAAAFPLIKEILALLNFVNVKLYVVTTVVVFLTFAGMYVGVYAVTARTYYRIVSR